MLILGRKSKPANSLAKSSMQAILILSGVAGLSSGNQSWQPSSARAEMMASLMAKSTTEAKKKGGSPTALEEWIAFGFGTPCTRRTVRLFKGGF